MVSDIGEEQYADLAPAVNAKGNLQHSFNIQRVCSATPQFLPTQLEERGNFVSLGSSRACHTPWLDAGLALSLAVTRSLHTWLFSVTTTDQLTCSRVTLLFCLMALAACYLPARRATQMEPTVTLRCK
jgi:hypothetical protein